jgi:hypothetical protein
MTSTFTVNSSVSNRAINSTSHCLSMNKDTNIYFRRKNNVKVDFQDWII